MHVFDKNALICDQIFKWLIVISAMFVITKSSQTSERLALSLSQVLQLSIFYVSICANYLQFGNPYNTNINFRKMHRYKSFIIDMKDWGILNESTKWFQALSKNAARANY